MVLRVDVIRSNKGVLNNLINYTQSLSNNMLGTRTACLSISLSLLLCPGGLTKPTGVIAWLTEISGPLNNLSSSITGPAQHCK